MFLRCKIKVMPVQNHQRHHQPARRLCTSACSDRTWTSWGSMNIRDFLADKQCVVAPWMQCKPVQTSSFPPGQRLFRSFQLRTSSRHADPLAPGVEWRPECRHAPASLPEAAQQMIVQERARTWRHRCGLARYLGGETQVATEGEKLSVGTQSGSRRQEIYFLIKWETWRRRLWPFCWASRGGSWWRPLCPRTTGRCPPWTGRSSPQPPSGPTCGKPAWPIPQACPTARTSRRCWLWTVSSGPRSQVENQEFHIWTHLSSVIVKVLRCE